MSKWLEEYLKLTEMRKQKQHINDGIMEAHERPTKWLEEKRALEAEQAAQKESGLDFFDGGAFDDDKGNFFTDLADTIGGTVTDIIMTPVKGALRLGEGIVDLGMYAVGGAADLLGADGFAEGVKDIAKFEAIEGLYDGIGITNITDNSVFGRTTQGILEGVGQVGGLIATGGLANAAGVSGTALTTGTMFASSAGSGMSEAYKDGATDEEALKYGVLKGGIDAGTELMFGGMGSLSSAVGFNKGLLGVDDMLASAAGKAFTSKVGKTVAQMGIKATAEGVEELAAGYLTAHAKKGTFQSEEDFDKILEDENLLEQFIVGTATGGIMQTGSISSSMSGRDIVTGLTENEQMVLDKEIEDRIAEAEKDGNELTNKDKKKIREEARKDLERGYINVDTIERALSPQTYDRYQKAVDSESKLEEEIKKLEDMPNAEITVKQAERLTEARKELEQLRQKDEKTTLKNMLNEEVRTATEKDNYLVESYNEKAKRGKVYEADVSKYSEAERKTIQKAIDSKVLNNSNKTHAFVDLMAKISADKGIDIDFANNKKLQESGFAIEGKTINGYVHNGNITLNISSPKAMEMVVGHEITHVLEGTDAYAELQEAVKLYAETKGDYAIRLEEVQNLYKDVKDANIENELTSKLVGEYLFSDENFINSLSTEKPNIFKRIYNEIKYFVKQVIPGSKEAKQLEKVKRMFDKAYKENVGTGENDNIVYSIEVSAKGEGKKVINTIYENLNMISNENVFNVNYDQKTETFKNKSDYVLSVFEEQGGTAYNERIGKVELVKAGAKSTIAHGFGKEKLATVRAIKNVIEKGTIISHVSNYKGTNVDRYIIAGKGIVEGKSAYVGAVIKSYPNSKNNSKFYLHEVTIVEADLPSMTAPQLSVDTVSKSASNFIITPTEQNASENPQFSLSGSRAQTTHNPNLTYGSDIGYDPSTETLWPINDGYDMGPVREVHATSHETGELPVIGDLAPNLDNFNQPVNTVKDRNAAKLENYKVELDKKTRWKENALRQYNREIADLQDYLEMETDQNSQDANELRRQIAAKETLRDNDMADFDKDINTLKERIKKMSTTEFKTAEQRQYKNDGYRQQMSDLMGDTSTWVDKTHGIQFKVNTLKRNLRDVVRDEHGNRDIAKANAIYNELQGKYNHNEAKMNNEANRIKQAFKEMHINKAEDQYIQMLGEYRHNPETTLTKEVVDKFYQEHKDKIDKAKVDRAIDMARDTYDDLFKRVNEVLKEQGMKEIPYREGYFPHFTEEKQGLLARILNWKKEDNSIPTDIAGLTEHFKPSKSWQSFSQRRNSDVTSYSALKGLDMYVTGALDWIYHIEDIQKFRAFENEIRYRHSEAHIQEQIKKIHNDETLDADTAQSLMEAVFSEAKNPLNNLVQNIRTHTNLLAGKKNTMDRTVEENFNRDIYSIVKSASSRVTANMVGGSVSSALTNFIPITQSWSQVSPLSTLKAMKATIQSIRMDDGVIAKSDFLTNRLKPAEKLSSTGWDKASEKLFAMMSAVDYFSSQTIWRSKYMENIDAGMSENEAVRNADEFAEGVMAGRSRGNMPVIFESKNPLTKMYTMFQLEVANQYGYMFKDMPQDIQSEKKGKLTKAYATMFLGAYAYNALFSQLTGRNAAFDPFRIIEELLQDLGWMGDDEEDEIADAFMNFGESVIDELPFIGTLTGGGRIPISSAMPYDGLGAAITGTIEDAKNGNWENLTKEWLNPMYYLAMPAGGGQLKKTLEGLSMYNDELPVPGSYTSSGNLRFAVDDSPLDIIQAAVFGQWANENAQDYIDNERQTLKSKQIEEFAELHDLGMTQKEYWDYREGLKDLDKVEDKVNYIATLDFTDEQKNVMVNNAVDRKSKVDFNDANSIAEYEKLGYEVLSFDNIEIVENQLEEFKELNEFGMSDIEYREYQRGLAKQKTPEEIFNYISSLDVSVKQKNIMVNNILYLHKPIDLSNYDDFSEFEEFDFYSKNPEKWTVSKAIGTYKEYTKYTNALKEIMADKDAKGNSVTGSRKEKVLEYINGIKASYETKIMLYKMEYPSDDTYNMEIIDYLNNRQDISRKEMETILKELGFDVGPDGTITW